MLRALHKYSGLLLGAALTLIGLSGSLLVLWWGVRRGLQPLQDLSSELNRREPTTLEPLQLGPVPAELTPVLETLNRLFARVADALGREQRFASQAAHEFRTPLTGIKTHLQVACRVTGELQQRALSRAEQGVARLQNVTEQLLMLARLELREGDGRVESCSVQRVIDGALSELPGRERVSIQASGKTADPIAMPEALAVVALRNLLENALKYSDRRRPVRLILATQGQRVCLTVSDSGTEADVDEEWQSLPRQSDSHGLGLAIVESILSSFRGRLVSEPNASGGLDQRLELPAGRRR